MIILKSTDTKFLMLVEVNETAAILMKLKVLLMMKKHAQLLCQLID
jgi:hypothetical protein